MDASLKRMVCRTDIVIFLITFISTPIIILNTKVERNTSIIFIQSCEVSKLHAFEIYIFLMLFFCVCVCSAT